MRVRPFWRKAACFGMCCLIPLTARHSFALDGGNSVLEERPTQINRLEPRSEATANQLQSAALYATGRALFQQGDTSSALRYYQRALRWDPSAAEIAAEIVPLAFSLQRADEAVRYALLSAERFETDPLLLRRLALYVTETEDWPRAARLYRKWLSHPETKLDSTQLDTLLVWLEVGRLEYLVGNTQQASHVLGKFQHAVLTAQPDSPVITKLMRAVGQNLNATWELCALAHVDAKAFDLAARALDEIEFPLQQTGRLGYRKAQVALAREQPLKAWEHLQRYFRYGPSTEGIGPFQLLKELLAQLNQGETIILELAKLRAENPGDDALKIALADELATGGNTNQALALYHSVATGKESISKELMSKAFNELFELYAKQGSAKGVLETLHLATDRMDGVAALEYSLARLSQRADLMDKVVKEANLADASALSSTDNMALASLMLDADRLDDANQFFLNAIRIDSPRSAEITLTWGLALIAAEENEQAAVVFQRGIEAQLLGDDDPTYLFYLSAALELTGRTDQALTIARQAAEMRSDSVEIASRVPWILNHAQRYSEATTAYETLLAKFDNHRDEATRKELRDARFSLSNLAVLDGDIASASEWLQTILDEFPDDTGAMNDLGYLWADVGLHTRHARRLIEQAVAKEPNNPAYRDSLGWAFWREGKTEAAIRELKMAIELSHNTASSMEHTLENVDAVILDHLGDAYLQAGHVQQALQWWQRALAQWQHEDADKATGVREKIAKHSAGEDAPVDLP